MTEKNRTPKGVPTGGEFAPQTRPEGAVGVLVEDTRTSEEKATFLIGLIEKENREFRLAEISRGDQLYPEEIEFYLRGDFDNFDAQIDDRFADQRYSNSAREARELCAANGIDFDDLAIDDQDGIRDAIENADVSEPVKDLLANTSDRLLRVQLGDNLAVEMYEQAKNDMAVYPPESEQGRAQRRKVLIRLLDDAGLDPEAKEVQDAVDEVLDEGPTSWHAGVTLDVMWTGAVGDANAVPYSTSEIPIATRGRKLAITWPHILLMDKETGQGWAASIPDQMVIPTVTPEQPAHLDSELGKNGHVSWTASTGGVHTPGYRPEAIASFWEAVFEER